MDAGLFALSDTIKKYRECLQMLTFPHVSKIFTPHTHTYKKPNKT